MCQVLFSKTANPPREAIIDANLMNKDGFGYAWVDRDTVRFDKGFDASELTDALIEKYLALPFPKAIHFRLATHGGVIPELTHPFPIKRGVPHDLVGTARAVLFHNGVWHDYDDRLREGIIAGTINPNVLVGGMSDSRAMAVLAQRFGEDFLDLLSFGSNKVLVLRHDTWYTYGTWTEKEGWSASNSRIFRPDEKRNDKGRYESKGQALDRSGLPVQGVLYRGGRRDDSERETVETGGVVMENGHRLNDDDGLPVMDRFRGSTDRYLNHDYEQVKRAQEEWARKGIRS